MNPEQVVSGLVRRGVPLPVAQGFAGNFAVESGFDPGINEISPLVAGSRGGFGLAQWTGPRRRQLEAYASRNGRPLADIDTQLDFLMWELGNTEASARDAIWGASDPATAAKLVSERFLRPGIPHLDRRLEETARIAGSTGDIAAPRNALAEQERAASPQANRLAMLAKFRPQVNALDPQAFMNRNSF